MGLVDILVDRLHGTGPSVEETGKESSGQETLPDKPDEEEKKSLGAFGDDYCESSRRILGL